VPGQMFGPYELRGLLGRGGMGEVHRAHDHTQAREVALKLLPAALASDEGFVERFKRESYAAARLNDPHVIPIHRYGEIDGRLYIDMRLVEGVDLGKLLERDGPLPPARAVSFVSQAAEALDAAHAAGLVHRDVKPSNLLVTNHDFVYLVDFGIAHIAGLQTHGKALTATGATIGTLDYMAPERFSATGAVDARADVYALACVLYEILTGRRPYPFDNVPALIHAHLSLPAPRATAVRAGLPSAFDDVIARGMAKDPEARYRTPGELAAAARAVRDLGGGRGTRVGAPELMAPSWPRPVPRPVPVPSAPRRRAGAAGLLVAGVGVLVAAVLAGVLLGRGGLGSRNEPAAPTAVAAAPAASAAPAAIPARAAPTVAVAPAPAPTRGAGDLGLPTPVTRPACDGGFITVVGSAVRPASYSADVARLLGRHSGSAYLYAEASCSSLRPRMPDGDSIYAVFLGPFPTQAQACATKRAVGGDSYVRVLDDVTPDDRLIKC
jgi:hypothetical protein